MDSMSEDMVLEDMVRDEIMEPADDFCRFAEIILKPNLEDDDRYNPGTTTHQYFCSSDHNHDEDDDVDVDDGDYQEGSALMTLPLGYRAYIFRSVQSRFLGAPDEAIEILVQIILSEIAAYIEGSDDWDESIEELIEELIHNREMESSSSSGLSEEIICQNLKLSMSQVEEEDLEAMCVVCQSEFERKELVGKLECGHKYHADCIKKWLLVNNSCPVCKRKPIP